MPITCTYKKYQLHFTFDAGTSRGILRRKDTYFILISAPKNTDYFGIGECGPLQGLSIDSLPALENTLTGIASAVMQRGLPATIEDVPAWVNGLVDAAWPAVRFGLETAVLDYMQGGQRLIVENNWAAPPFHPIPINGLVWMGDRDFMKKQIDEKLAASFHCIKMKIGAIDFETELALLAYIRQQYDKDTVTLRVDANGAFTQADAPGKLRLLAKYDLHSIEQPIASGQPAAMRKLCAESPLPIALDEELIGVQGLVAKRKLLEDIRPQYIILKPTLLGGLHNTQEWITLANQLGIGWWITSALESNVGLNAIAQFTSHLGVTMPQGLGTGQLYHNNITSPLYIDQGSLKYDPKKHWDFSNL